MKTIREMLEAEIKASTEFESSNFGLMAGDGFREMVEDVLQSETTHGMLLIGLLMAGLGGKEMAQTMKESGPQKLGPTIMKHFNTFKGPLEMLYWGIQIGRKLERAEQEALSKMEKEIANDGRAGVAETAGN